jgi:hypothetical protein
MLFQTCVLLIVSLAVVQCVDVSTIFYEEISLNEPLNQAANEGILMAYEIGTVTYYNLAAGTETIEDNISKRKIELELKFGLAPCFKEELELWYDLVNTNNVTLVGRRVLEQKCRKQMYQASISAAKNEEDRYAGFSTYDFDFSSL